MNIRAWSRQVPAWSREVVTVRGQLVSLAVTGFLLTLLVGATGLVGQHQIVAAGQTESTIAEAQRLHQHANLRRDGLRHAVISAVLISSGRVTASGEDARSDVAQQARQYRGDLTELDRLRLPARLESEISKIRPQQEGFIALAERLVPLAFTDLPRARAQITSFVNAFDRLATSEEKVTELMAATVAEAKSASDTVRFKADVAMLVVGVTAVLILAALSYLIGRSIVGSLSRIQSVVRARGRGDLMARATEGPDELGQLAAEFNRMADSVNALHDQSAAHAENLDKRVQERTEQLTATNVELVAARNLALTASRSKSEFLATMSHEIRTPMNGVIGLTTLLLETSLNQAQRQYAEGVKGAGEALLSVINDILDFSKLEAGKVELELADFDVRRLVEDVGSLLAPTAFVKRVELLAYCLPEVPAQMCGDAGRLRQILLNLASNAVKFTSAGEVAIKVSSAPAADGRVMLRVEVSDTGIGIAEQDQDRLFDSFSQADASTTRRFGGTGLGLAISRRLVESMEGQIAVRSTVGAGSTFRVEIPLAVGSNSEVEAPAPSDDLLTGLRVLVVDDNATNRLILKSQLSSWLLQPDVVEDARSALVRMHQMVSQARPYDIVVLDMHMPEMDGLQLAQAISADQALRGTPMIMLTSTSQVDTVALRGAGVAGWLTKPVRSSEFSDLLVRVMAAHVGSPTIPPQGRTNVRPLGPGSLGRVLVVEDNTLNQLVAEGVLSLLGYQVDLVANGSDAVEAVQHTSYAAVLMDCHMPVMDGFEATKAIRRGEGSGNRVPIIAMTAAAMAEDRERCLAAGMDDYVSKPVDTDTLGTVLARWVESSPAPAASPAASPAVVSRAVASAQAAGPTIDQERLAGLFKLGSLTDSNLVSVIVDIFVRDSASSLAALREAAGVGAVADLEASAHKLKGASANIGANRVVALCSTLEADAHSMDAAQTSRLLDALEVELSRATAALLDAQAAAAVPLPVAMETPAGRGDEAMRPTPSRG